MGDIPITTAEFYNVNNTTYITPYSKATNFLQNQNITTSELNSDYVSSNKLTTMESLNNQQTNEEQSNKMLTILHQAGLTIDDFNESYIANNNKMDHPLAETINNCSNKNTPSNVSSSISSIAPQPSSTNKQNDNMLNLTEIELQHYQEYLNFKKTKQILDSNYETDKNTKRLEFKTHMHTPSALTKRIDEYNDQVRPSLARIQSLFQEEHIKIIDELISDSLENHNRIMEKYNNLKNWQTNPEEQYPLEDFISAKTRYKTFSYDPEFNKKLKTLAHDCLQSSRNDFLKIKFAGLEHDLNQCKDAILLFSNIELFEVMISKRFTNINFQSVLPREQLLLYAAYYTKNTFDEKKVFSMYERNDNQLTKQYSKPKSYKPSYNSNSNSNLNHNNFSNTNNFNNNSQHRSQYNHQQYKDEQPQKYSRYNHSSYNNNYPLHQNQQNDFYKHTQQDDSYTPNNHTQQKYTNDNSYNTNMPSKMNSQESHNNNPTTTMIENIFNQKRKFRNSFNNHQSGTRLPNLNHNITTKRLNHNFYRLILHLRQITKHKNSNQIYFKTHLKNSIHTNKTSIENNPSSITLIPNYNDNYTKDFNFNLTSIKNNFTETSTLSSLITNQTNSTTVILPANNKKRHQFHAHHPICNNLFLNITNKGIINKSLKVLSHLQTNILSLGLNFIPTPKPSTNKQLLTDLKTYIRLLRLKCYFAFSQESTPFFDKQFAAHTSTWQPPLTSHTVEDYINNLTTKFKTKLKSYPIKQFPKQSKLVINTLNQLRNDKTIIIKKADKNLGLVILDTNWYLNEVSHQLNDKQTYKNIENLPITSIIYTELCNILTHFNKLHKNDKTFTSIAIFLLSFHDTTILKTITAANFYIIPKIHKPIMVGRPIASSFSTPTINASKYLDKLLNPIMQQFKSYIKNSLHLILILENLKITPGLHESETPSNIYLLTADIESLYPSIEIEDGLTQLKKALYLHNEYLPTLTMDTNIDSKIDFICQLMHFVLANNFITFNNKHYLQIKGTAMGTPCAVTFACIYVSMLETETEELMKIKNLPLTSYHIYRFIDDFFGIFPNKPMAINYIDCFNIIRKGKIKLTSKIDISSVDFLDVTIFKGNRFQEKSILDFKVYQKPFNTYLYIPPTSFHNKSIFPNFICSEIQRYCVICNNDTDYQEVKSLFYKRLQTRGYTETFLQPIFDKIYLRSSLISKSFIIFNKNNNNQKFECNLPIFKTYYTPRQIKLNLKSILTFDQKTRDDYIFINTFGTHCPTTPILCYKRQKNLSDYLTNSKFF
jgi:hypothetical protein